MASNNSEILGELDGESGRKPAAAACFTAPGIKDKVRGVKNSAGEVVDMRKGVILVLFLCCYWQAAAQRSIMGKAVMRAEKEQARKRS